MSRRARDGAGHEEVGMADESGENTKDSPSGLSRRQALGLGAAAAGAVAAGSVLGAGAAHAANPKPAAQLDFPVAPKGTTLDSTLLHGTPDASGYRPVVSGAGEPFTLRTDLSGSLTRGTGRRRALAAFAQFTDMHIIDAQSPARVEFLDRLNDPDSPVKNFVPFSSAYRAQEMLTLHVAESMVHSVNGLSGAPASGRTIDFTISTGDNADNTQFNEVRWQIDVMDGRKFVRPDSGNYAKWEGVGGNTDLDTFYWHPDGTPAGDTPDRPHTLWGFPDAPGLLNRCRMPFRPVGLATPWYSSFGNHDGLVQGTVPGDAAMNAIAVGAVKVTALPPGIDLFALLVRLQSGDWSALVDILTAGPAKPVTPDPKRRLLSRPQVVAEHFKTTGTPVGHGYRQANLRDGTAYYAFQKGNITYISLDTVNPNGFSDGSLDSAQLAWLESRLQSNSSRWLDTDGNWVSGTGTDRYIVIFSHHTVETMTNLFGPDRIDGTTVANLLLRYPNVVAWVNGHTHENHVVPYPRAATAAVGGGFWEVNTASHVDWPQQCRIVEIVDNGDGATVSVFGTIVDHAAQANPGSTPTTPLQLASLSRQLGINDWQRDAETADRDGKRGEVEDRNVELLLPKPF
jgi:metallophosphoesterase (TIGR03767 family)